MTPEGNKTPHFPGFSGDYEIVAILLVAAQALAILCAHGQTVQPLDAKTSAIVNRPEFRHAMFGMGAGSAFANLRDVEPGLEAKSVELPDYSFDDCGA